MSLSACVAEITKELTQLRRDVSDLQRENKELKDILTHSHHQWWKCSRTASEDLVDDLIHSSNQPEYLKWR